MADDLSGANDTAVQFVKHGLSALVITHTQFPGDHASYEVLSLNSGSREMDENAAYNAVRNLIKSLKTHGLSGSYYKKVDSVLRGNPAPELTAVMDELDIPLAITAPSFPANRSILEQGMIKSGDNNAVADAVKIFSVKTSKKAESIPLDKIRLGECLAAEYVLDRHAQGIEVFVADAVNDEDLAMVYRLSATLAVKLPQPHVLAGSAGLANHIAANLAKNLHDKKEQLALMRPFSPGAACFPVLVAAGTRQGETAAQITALSGALQVPVIRFKTDLAMNGRGDEAVTLAYEEAAGQMKNKARLCIVAVESMFKAENPGGDPVRNKAESKAISMGLGSLTGALMESFKFPLVVSSGGDTSLEVCKRLGITGIEPLAEIRPGIPIGRIVGGSCENRYIITKSGRFGSNNTLIEALHYLEAE